MQLFLSFVIFITMLKFFKMQALGNDYIYIDCTQNKIKFNDIPKICPKICDTHFGIGADGVILIQKSSTSDARIHIFNKDGSYAKMCGNAIRCVAFYLCKKLKKTKVKIQTFDREVLCKVIVRGKNIAFVLARLGKVQLKNVGKNFVAFCGNKHLVIIKKNLDFDINKKVQILGEKIRKNYNIEFMQIKSKNEINIKVYERGSGETLACGSGAVASACVLNKIYNSNKIKVNLLGGNLTIYFYHDYAYMCGLANFVFMGECEIDEFY